MTNSSQDIQSLFFELIRVSLGTQDTLSRTPTEREWSLLYKMAQKQSLLGICFAGVQKTLSNSPMKGEDPSVIGMPEMLYLRWLGMATKIQQRNEVVNRQCVDLQKRLSADGCRSYIMKGQAVAALYRLHENDYENLSQLRQSGDIDVFWEGGLEKVLAYARTFGEVQKVNELEMSVPVFPDTEVEFHYRPLIMRNPFKNAKLQTFFDDCAERNFSNRIKLSADSLEIVAPTTEFNLVHQLAHIHLHLFTEGIGMRQLMDYYFVLLDYKTKTIKTPEGFVSNEAPEIENKFSSSASSSSTDSPAVQFKHSGKKHEKQLSPVEVISDLGLNRFASALMWVIKTVFVGHENHNENDNFYLWEPNEEDGRLLLDEVIQSGNFGHNDEVLNRKKQRRGYSVWALFFKNLKFFRFDRDDWFWGPLWRIMHKVTIMK